MLQHIAARPTWRAFVVRAAAASLCAATIPAAIGVVCPVPAFAQVRLSHIRVSWDANASVAQFDPPGTASGLMPVRHDDVPWLDQRAMGGALRLSNPFTQISADAAVRSGDVSSRATGNVFALLASPAWKGFRISASASERHMPHDGMVNVQWDSTSLALRAPQQRIPTWQSKISANVSYAHNQFGAWIRADSRQGAGTSDSVSRWSMATGLSYQLRNTVLGMSLGTRGLRDGVMLRSRYPVILPPHSANNPTDSVVTQYGFDSVYTTQWKRWPEAAFTLGWARGRLAFDGVLSARARIANLPAATWGEAASTIAVTPRIAVVANLRTVARTPGMLYGERRFASVGLRVAPPSLWRSISPIPVRAVTQSFNVKATTSGEYTITLTVPSARTVEIAGDFTGWKAVELRQVNNTRWEIMLKVDPGSHRCNVRIDGADWIAPPGVPTVHDEFNGRVGLFVAE